MDDYYPNLSPIRTGLACKCPRCGGGKLFSGFLTVRETCAVCGLDLRPGPCEGIRCGRKGKVFEMNNSLLKRGTVVTLAIMLGLSVAACGKKGPLEPPTDKGYEYPRDYPAQ